MKVWEDEVILHSARGWAIALLGNPFVVALAATAATSASAFEDGSGNAPPGTPQFESLLKGYAVRPDWKVAGVDYYVGTPDGTVLKDPATISMAMGSV